MLLDPKLPRRSGLEVLAWLRTSRDSGGCRRVLSSSREAADINQAYELGVGSYLVKPVSFDDLVELWRTRKLSGPLLSEAPDVWGGVTPMQARLRVLLVDDDPDDRELVRRELAREFPGLEATAVTDAAAFARALEGERCDLVVTDYRLRWGDGLAVLRAVKARWPGCAVLMFTGTGDEEVAVTALHAGLDEYVVKRPGPRGRLATAARRALERVRDRAAAREAEARYRALFEGVPVGLFRSTPEGAILDANAALVAMLGYPDPAALRSVPAPIFDLDPAARERLHALARETGVVAGVEVSLRRRDGSVLWGLLHLRAVRDAAGRVVAYEGSVVDVTARRVAEAALARRARQQEAVAELGRLVLGGTGLDTVFGRAAEVVAGVLGVEYAKVLELAPEGDVLRLRAGVGWRPGAVGSATVEVSRGSQAGYTLEVGGPVLVEDLAAETRFAAPALLREHGVRSGMSVVIPGWARPFGVLGAHATRPRAFGAEDADFLRAVAHLLGAAVDHQRAQEALQRSEALFRSVFEESRVGMAVQSLDGRYLRVNRALCDLLGYQEDELLATTWQALTLPEDLELEPNRRLLAGEISSYEIEKRYRHRQGHPVWTQVSVALVRAPDGQPSHFVVQVRDLTSRKAAEEALRRSEARYRRLVESLRDVIYTLAPDGTLISLNAAFEVLTGWRREEWLGRPFAELVHPEDLPRARELFEHVLGGAVVPLHQLRIRTRSGEYRVAELTPTLLREGDTVVGVLGIARDVTERRRAEEILRQRDKLVAMGELLAGVAHELNNPLSVVVGQAALIRAAAPGGKLAERATKLAEAADRCARIVRNFLALARQRPPERAESSLNQVVEGALELVAYALRVDGVQVTRELAPDLPLLWADPDQLHQVVVNLLTNAHHALRQTPPPRQLVLRTGSDRAAGRVWLEVADNGPGIPPEIQARIFEPFFTTKPPGQGTGLGLALCLGIVEGHGGTITVDSAPGRGARFRVELPVGATPRAEVDAGASEAAGPSPGLTLLVVDDEPEVASLLADMLGADGHQVDTAGSGEAALERLARRRYDLVLSDLRMPGIDGPGLYRELARHHPALTRRFVALTGDALSPAMDAFLAETRVPTVAKPFALADLRRVLREVLRGAGSA